MYINSQGKQQFLSINDIPLIPQCPDSPWHSQDAQASGGAQSNGGIHLEEAKGQGWWWCAIRDGVSPPAKGGHKKVANRIVLVLALSDSVQVEEHTMSYMCGGGGYSGVGSLAPIPL